MFIFSVNVDVAVSGLSHNNVKHENLQNMILNSVNLQIFPVAYIFSCAPVLLLLHFFEECVT